MLAEPPRRRFQPFVTVIVPVYNEEQHIEACIRSLLAQRYPRARYEVLIVDGYSTDRTVEIASRFPVTVLPNPGRNAASGRNIGIERARGEFCAFTDGDVEVQPDWLAKLVDAFARYDGAPASAVTGSAGDTAPIRLAAVGGPNVTPKNVTPFTDALGYMLRTFWGSYGSVQGYIYDRPRFVPSLANCNAFYRKAVMVEIGGYDAQFVTGQDNELNLRITRSGYKELFLPDIVVLHKIESTPRAWFRRMFQYGRARTTILKKHPRTFKPLFALPLLFVLFLALAPLVIAGYGNLWPPTTIATVLAYGAAIGVGGYFMLMLFIALALYPLHRRVGHIGRVFLGLVSQHLAYGLGEWYGTVRPYPKPGPQPGPTTQRGPKRPGAPQPRSGPHPSPAKRSEQDMYRR